MKWIRQRVLNKEIMSGVWLNMGSGAAAEMCGCAGYDWVLIDLEHGSGGFDSLLPQLHAIETTETAPLVRIRWNETPLFKRVLDVGASGVMVPYVENAEQAQQAASAMKYPPHGNRGVHGGNRGTKFGDQRDEYYAMANENLLTIAQIENRTALDNLEEIAAVDGIDVLFIGPADLSFSLGKPWQLTAPELEAAFDRVIKVAHNAGKAAGILLFDPDQLAPNLERGFTFVANNSDSTAMYQNLKKSRARFDKFKTPS